MHVSNFVGARQSHASTGQEGSQFKLLYTKAEAAEMLSVSVRTIENLIGNKELAARRIGRRVLIPHQSLLQFIRADHETRRIAERPN
jgi:excisionase family DNA binding protein